MRTVNRNSLAYKLGRGTRTGVHMLGYAPAYVVLGAVSVAEGTAQAAANIAGGWHDRSAELLAQDAPESMAKVFVAVVDEAKAEAAADAEPVLASQRAAKAKAKAKMAEAQAMGAEVAAGMA